MLLSPLLATVMFSVVRERSVCASPIVVSCEVSFRVCVQIAEGGSDATKRCTAVAQKGSPRRLVELLM